MHLDHKVMNDEVRLKLKRGVAPSGFKKGRCYLRCKSLRGDTYTYTLEVFNKYIDIEEKSNMWVSCLSLSLKAVLDPRQKLQGGGA